MWKCRRVRGLIAAAVYGDLDPGEQQDLDAHLHQCPACRTELNAVRAFAGSLPESRPEINLDLVPALRRELRIQRAGAPRRFPAFRRQWAAVAAITLIVIALTYPFWPDSARPSLMTASLSPVQKALAAAEKRAGDRQYAAAYKTLRQALDQYPQDPAAGEAVARLAQICFNDLNWYPEAFEAYELLAKAHPAIYTNSPECIINHNCLLETRDADFAPLYALAAARRNEQDQFAQLEQIVGRYPETFVAAMAVEDMARLAAVELAAKDPAAIKSDHAYVAALTCAKDRCTNPIACARLKLELAHIYGRELNDAKMARNFYSEVTESGDLELAALAQDALAHLDKSN